MLSPVRPKSYEWVAAQLTRNQYLNAPKCTKAIGFFIKTQDSAFHSVQWPKPPYSLEHRRLRSFFFHLLVKEPGYPKVSYLLEPTETNRAQLGPV